MKPPSRSRRPRGVSGRATSVVAAVRPEALAAAPSGIVEIFNYGRERPDVIPLWVGEGDLPTPRFIQQAALRSLEAGETFYAAQRGLVDLRAAIARYMERTYGSPFSSTHPPFTAERFSVTVGGMHALQIATRLVAGVGAEVIVPTPAWPNFAGALATAGAEPVETPLDFVATEQGFAWRLDIERMAAAITPATRAIVVNTPLNPTGWTASRDELVAILALARRHGLWIIADEIYGGFIYDQPRAPSFHDIMEERDRVLFIQTLSKNWAMTGWRVGWLEAPAELGHVIENLIQYSTSGVATAIQRAAIAALDGGDPFLETQRLRARQSRDTLCAGLAATGRARFAIPSGGFYLFCAFNGFANSRELAFRLVDEAKVGVAPGSAFGAVGASFVRMCFAREPREIEEVVTRLAAWLRRI